MSRFLFVVPPLAGHASATVTVGAKLISRGHQVAWTGYGEVLEPLLPAGARVLDVGELRHDLTDPGAASLRRLWEGFLLPLASAMAPGVEAAVDRFAPDVLVVDQQALAGAVVARQRGIPWATSATTSAELNDPLAGIPKVDRWIRDRLRGLRDVPNGGGGDLRFSEHLVLAFTTDALVGPLDRFPRHYAFVGPSLRARPPTTRFPWRWLDPERAHVLVSLGGVNGDVGGPFLQAAARALQPLGDRLQAVVVAPSGLLGDQPDHILVRQAVPELKLLPEIDAVVTHAGHNAVCETLAHGVPLVVAPIRDDQPIVAEQVGRAGAAHRVRFSRVRAADLRRAVLTVLDDPSFRDSARRVQASFAAAGGALAAARRLEALA